MPRYSSVGLGLSCVILYLCFCPVLGAQAQRLEPAEILNAVSERQEQLINHEIEFESWTEPAGGEHPQIYSQRRTVYGDNFRMDSTGVWSGREPQRGQSIVTPTTQKSWNTFGSDENYLGSIRAVPADGHFRIWARDMYSPWLFCVASGDSDYAWRLMAEYPQRIVASEKNVNGTRRIELSADLPSGRYTLEVEPDFEYRIRGFTFEKIHSEGHFPPVPEDQKQHLPPGQDHFVKFSRGAFEVEEFSNVGSLWFPRSGQFDFHFHYTHMPGPGFFLWKVRVDEFRTLKGPPPPETFEMNWPPHCLVDDRTISDGANPPRFYADQEGDLHRVKKLEIGDAVPALKGDEWFDEAAQVELEDLSGKYVFVYNWAVWCGPCLILLPKFQKFYEEFRDQPDVVFLGLNSYDERDDVAKYMEEKGVDFPQLWGEDARIAKNLLGFVGAGEGCLWGPDGKVIALSTVNGGLDLRDDTVRRLLAELLQ